MICIEEKVLPIGNSPDADSRRSGGGSRRAFARSGLCRGGFSLVEVVLAIGVVAFGFVGIFALLPTGLEQFHKAMDVSVGSQIVQRIASDAAQADFDALLASSGTGEFFVMPLRYFDDQGSEVKVNSPGAPSAAEKAQILYTVRVRGARPGASDPREHSDGHFVSLPATSGTVRFNPRNFTMLTVQIVNNPAVRDLGSAGVIDVQTQLIDAQKAAAKGLPVRTYPVAVARNDSLIQP